MSRVPVSYCLLTGDRCSCSPILTEPYAFFISEPYDEKRSEREKCITEAIKGYNFIISDHNQTNISITCKICGQIQSSYFGIVDITNYNKNVLIELGMLFGFNKPVVILLKRSKSRFFGKDKTQIGIPSIIIGMAQIRYDDFVELETKLKKSLTTLFEISKKQAAFLVDIKPILALQIQQIEMTLLAKKALDSQLEGKVQFYQYLNGKPIFIINKGNNEGIKENMILSVVNLTLVNGQWLEEVVGQLVVTYIQEKISKCQLVQEEPNAQQFWVDLQNGQSPNHVFRPFINEELGKLTEEELIEIMSKYKILLKGIAVNENDRVGK